MNVKTIALFGAAWNLAIVVAMFALGWHVTAVIWLLAYAVTLPRWLRTVRM